MKWAAALCIEGQCSNCLIGSSRMGEIHLLHQDWSNVKRLAIIILPLQNATFRCPLFIAELHFLHHLPRPSFLIFRRGLFVQIEVWTLPMQIITHSTQSSWDWEIRRSPVREAMSSSPYMPWASSWSTMLPEMRHYPKHTIRGTHRWSEPSYQMPNAPSHPPDSNIWPYNCIISLPIHHIMWMWCQN